MFCWQRSGKAVAVRERHINIVQTEKKPTSKKMQWSMLLIFLIAPCNSDITVNGTTSQSSDYTDAEVQFFSDRAVDGNITTCSHTLQQRNSWWRIDLLAVYNISSVRIYSKTHHNLNMKNTQIYIGNSRDNNGTNNNMCKNITESTTDVWKTYDCNRHMMGRYITVFSPDHKYLILCEVRICGTRQESPFKLIKENKTWEEALNHCRSTERDLASILDSDSQAWAELEAERAQTAFVWLGLHYTCTLEFWFWVEDHQLAFSRWSPINKTEDCDMSAALETQMDHLWFSMSDYKKFNFICTKY